MSSRARVVTDVVVEPFHWAPVGPPKPAPAPVPPPQVAAPAAQAAAPVTPEALSIQQQERLAALEREAFTKGYAQGERAGLEAGGKRAEAMLRRVAQTLEELGTLRKDLMQQSERQMVQLALTLARRVVHREITLDPELIAAMAHVAIKKLGISNPSTIRLHPDDYTIVARDGDRWSGSNVSVVPDPSISRGGCMVESDFGNIDGSLDRQFDEMARALLGGAGTRTIEAEHQTRKHERLEPPR
jgi:flagellar assembly protein FliH